MVRQPTEVDLDACLDILKEFAGHVTNRGTLDLDKTEALLLANMENTLISEVDGFVDGIIMGVYHEHPFLDLRCLTEVAWYVRGGDGLKLLREFDALAKEIGVDVVSASTLYDNPRAGIAFRRLGFQPSEVAWYKHMRT